MLDRNQRITDPGEKCPLHLRLMTFGVCFLCLKAGRASRVEVEITREPSSKPDPYRDGWNAAVAAAVTHLEAAADLCRVTDDADDARRYHHRAEEILKLKRG